MTGDREAERGDPRAASPAAVYVLSGPHAPLLRYARLICGDRQRAEDLVQDALLRMWERRDRLTEVGSPEAYARRIITNRYISTWRQVLRREHLTGAADSGDGDGMAPDVIGELADLDVVRRGVSQLPRRQQVALVLRFYEDLPYADIAATLNCPESSARTLVTRGLVRLRTLLALPPATGSSRSGS